MPIYVEMIKDSKTGKMIEKKVGPEKKKQYYIRTYTTDEFGNKKQVTRHNKEWIGLEGKNKAQQEENLLKNKVFIINENMILDELAEKYFKHIEDKLKPSSVTKNKDNYLLHIKPFLGFKKVSDLSNKDILEFHEYLNKKENQVRNQRSKREIGSYHLSVAYKQSIHITLVAILNFDCKYYGLQKNVASIVGNFKKQKGSVKNELQFLTKKEFDEFIKYEENDIYRDFFILLFYTGMRRGELLALTSTDIDFKKNEISINKSINPRNGTNHTSPKTNRSNRKIKMLRVTKETLSKYSLINGTIFGLSNIKPTTLQRKCDNNCKMANINKNIRIHDFRHSFASMCIERKVPIEIISEYLGHENISTTLNIYAHLYPNSQNKLIEMIDGEKQENISNKTEFINYIMNIVNEALSSGKSKEELGTILQNIEKDYLSM